MPAFHDLTEQQLAVVDFICNGQDTLLCADVGTGKTVMALTAMMRCRQDSTIDTEAKVNRWLVFAPKAVAENTWRTEPGDWDHLRDVEVAIACGTEVHRHAAMRSRASIVVTNYENMEWTLDHYGETFDGLVCDELDKLKSVSSIRFKAIKRRIKHFNMRVGMTGTILPTELTDLWAQVFIVDGGVSFGKSYYRWRQKYFYPTDYKRRKWAPMPHTRNVLLARIRDLAIRIPQGEEIPEVVYESPQMIEPSIIWRREYNEFKAEHLFDSNISNLTEQEDHTVLAVNNAVATGKLQQFTAGFLYSGGGLEQIELDSGEIQYKKAPRETIVLDESKIRALVALRKRLGDAQLLVVYRFQQELDALTDAWGDEPLPVIGGKTTALRAQKHIDRWNAGAIKTMVIHAQSAGHGLNLQRAGAHHIAFLTLPWSGGMLKQVVGRLARRGNTAPQVHVWSFLYSDSVDERVFDIVTARAQQAQDFADAISIAQPTAAGTPD